MVSVTEDEDDGEDFDVIALGEMLGEELEDNDGDWDEDLLLKTSSHLLAKGISYLFMDNHLYSLVS